MDEVAAAKMAMRRTLRAARRQLDATTRAAEAAATCAELARLLLPGRPLAVASYAALADELDVSAFHHACWRAGIPVLLPRVAAERVLTWHRLSDAGAEIHMKHGSFGIREPDPQHLPAEALPPGIPLVVPGVAFTADGHRLGQGGGFYDRVLEKAGHRAVGVGFSCQLVEHVPCEPHDRVLDALVIAGRLVLALPDAIA